MKFTLVIVFAAPKLEKSPTTLSSVIVAAELHAATPHVSTATANQTFNFDTIRPEAQDSISSQPRAPDNTRRTDIEYPQ